MATRQDFAPLAERVVAALGGPGNIRSVTHCATRLRFKIRENDKADLQAADAVDGVLTAIHSGGQYQVVIGNDVPFAYEAVTALDGMASKGVKDSVDEDGAGEEMDADGGDTDKNLLNKFIDLVSALFSPILWCLAGLGLGKAFLTLAETTGLLEETSDTYVILNATFDGIFYFLPLFLALTAARRFKVNQFIALSMMAPLVLPQIVALSEAENVHLFGIPLNSMNYSSSVIPAIIAVWVAGYLQRWLEKVLPGAVRNFFTPLIVVAVMVPLVLLTIGPVTLQLGNWLSDGLNWLLSAAPWLGGAVLGAFWQVFVLFGLHWSLIPVFLNDIAVQGYTLLMGPLLAAVLAQASAAAAVWIRAKDPERKKVAGPGVISGFLAGVTEPIIYGVNLPLKYPFYVGLGSGAVGGAIIGMAHGGMDTFVFPSVLALPAAVNVGTFGMTVLGTVVAVILGFVGTWFVVPMAERKLSGAAVIADAPAEPKTADVTGQVTVLAPVPGNVVPLEDVDDKVFASGAMGAGVGIEPAGRSTVTVTSPVSGKLIAVQKTGHAYGIRGDNGAEVLVHVGIDTVKMGGTGFSTLVERGQHVSAGEALGTVDLAAVAEAGYPATTLVIVTNTKKLTAVTPVASGDVAGGATILDIEN
ncbi:PTS system beta-glucoside-specific EIIBCA component [Corynebacterium glyciniphilum AJ 3170]|uniref:PTS system beta-glucoside-specific EIIBCA component n=1 Tax=Corynebacterium glyciniphilum AJ 3170 TaxID=1404245 RepID=X5DHL2_9CORY|nr:beta-glucoside-specific PTS transporter subunit IIABC [Corynebacterium glyciniphilum]AHW62528.1 PTS system beta-glucoside-specific EIIBCA component [Corynebacterium glyciniphilum AJ 3170]